MELHKVPRTTKGTWVRVLDTTDAPPDSPYPTFKPNDLVLYYHTDGMYSYCKDRAGNVVHLRAWADVEVIGEET